jgi:hypothetical protein
MRATIANSPLGLAVLLGLAGCNQPVATNPPPPPPSNAPVEIIHPQADRTPGSGTQVDVNPPGGGIHVNVPPNSAGPGAHVDVGPGGVNVTKPGS